MELQVLDGGASSELTRAGFDFITNPLWSSVLLLSNTDEIKKVHKSFLECGADIIETLSYQANYDFFQKYANKTKEEAEDLIKLSVRLARRQLRNFGQKTKTQKETFSVWLSWPIRYFNTDWSEYKGNYIETADEDSIKEYQRPRIRALVDAGADVIALETVPALKEGEIVAVLMREFPNTKAWVSFSCKDGEHLRHGEKFFDAVRAVCSSGVVNTVGINCTAPNYVTPLLKSSQKVQKECGARFVVYPNSGEVLEDESDCTSPWVGKSMAMDFPHLVPEWIHLGATIIGGCCRTTPKDISIICDTVRSLVRK